MLCVPFVLMAIQPKKKFAIPILKGRKIFLGFAHLLFWNQKETWTEKSDDNLST